MKITMTTQNASRRIAPARIAAKAPPTKAPRPATGLSPAEIRQIVLDILG
jgi:hypothetical protein